MSGNDPRKISSLRDLPRDIAPPRDLWKGIEAQLTAGELVQSVPQPRRNPYKLRVLAAAAVIAALAVGVWIGRSVLPVPGAALSNGGALTANSGNGSGGTHGVHGTSGLAGDEPGAFHAAYVLGPKYINQRSQLVADLESRLAKLPPDSKAKVLASLAAINNSKRDLERELGKDPSNALLQELLVNTYQDEMRVLTAVHEAGSSSEGI